jgi:rRNA maturation endonuclease Nob1
MLIVLVLCLQIDALLRSYDQEHGDKVELLKSALKTADLGILLGAPLSNGDYSMTRVASLLSHAVSTISSGEKSSNCNRFSYMFQLCL